MGMEQQWLAFRVGEQAYGVGIGSVREIVRTPEITAVPQSPEHVAGVMNLAWVALIAAFILVEKLFPAGRLVSRLASAALILPGLFLLAGM
jgi:hypothetical protein